MILVQLSTEQLALRDGHMIYPRFAGSGIALALLETALTRDSLE
jgi:hypothetical protein